MQPSKVSENAVVLPWYMSIINHAAFFLLYPSSTQIPSDLQYLQNTAHSTIISLSLSQPEGDFSLDFYWGLPHSHQWWLTSLVFAFVLLTDIVLWYRTAGCAGIDILQPWQHIFSRKASKDTGVKNGIKQSYGCNIDLCIMWLNVPLWLLICSE